MAQAVTALFFSFVVFLNTAMAAESTHSKTEVQIFSDTSAVSSQRSLQVLVKITPKNDWHIYWENPGDTGMPTKATLSSTIGQSRLIGQSAPKHFYLHNLITQYAYDEAAYWLFEISPDEKNLPVIGEDVLLSVEASWLACKDECVGESVSESLSLPVEEAQSQTPQNWENELYRAKKTFPHTYLKGYFFTSDGEMHVQIPNFGKKLSRLQFIPFIRDLLINNQPVSFTTDVDGILTIHASLKEDTLPPDVMNAVLLTNQGVWQVHLSLQPFDFIKTQNDYPLGTIMFMAFWGGLILNLMPCIFPILFIKTASLMNSVYASKKSRIDSLMYFCGVVFSFMVVAAVLWGLQQGGESIGWGFQLQSPVFIAFLFILFFIIGLMFLGGVNFNSTLLNRLGTISVKNEWVNAFLTGLFAVLIASPCSAPFMGVAIGYSMTQPLYIYLPIFLALAVGYALPFTLIELSPKTAAKILPRPGKWMDTLKKIFSIPVFATCLWLGWIFYNQIIQTKPVMEKISGIEWQPFSEQKLLELKTQKKPVFIDFTAKWCLTCLVNEKTTLSSKTFRDIVQTQNIVLLKADWTNQDEDIAKALAQYHRNSVPLYVYYNGKQETPIILPQLLTSQIIEQYMSVGIK